MVELTLLSLAVTVLTAVLLGLVLLVGVGVAVVWVVDLLFMPGVTRRRLRLSRPSVPAASF